MSKAFVFGLNYATSDFMLREKLAFLSEDIPSVLQRLQNSGITKEIVVLSTCNRTEIYCITHDIDFVINAICDIQNVCPRTVKKYSYVYSGENCVNHLFRVVSGLESMVLGETEIVAQVKDALNLAKKYNTVGTLLSIIFQMALAVEKDVRNVTAINNIAISMGSALVHLVNATFGDLSQIGILFIGAGDMFQNILPHFKNMPFARKIIVNRTVQKAQILAKRINADFANLDALPSIIDGYSIIIACSGGKVLLDQNLIKQDNNKRLIIDLSMPLITDLTLGDFENITVLTIDDIAKIVDVGIEKRKTVALNANNIIDAKLVEYQNWLKKRGLAPVIKAFRSNADEVRKEVLLNAQKQLDSGEAPDVVLGELSVKLTNRLIHNPTVNLCRSTDKLQNELVGLLTYLYDLEIQANE